jgi:O-antigen/teichoic acid export membrane protein
MSNDDGQSSTVRLPLRKRVLKAGAWTLSGYFVGQVIRFGSNLVMTRLLAPEMYGLMTIAATVLSGLAMFVDLGLRLNFIQSKRDDTAFLNTAWITQIIQGSLITFGALLLAALLGVLGSGHDVPKDSAYLDPQLPFVLAALSITGFIAGCHSTKLYEASRKISLGQITKIEITSQIAGLISMLGWALVDRSIWTLVVGAITTRLTWTALTHLWLPGHSNRFQWDRSAFREIVGFGRWIFVSSVLGFLAGNSDRLLLGSFVNPSVLGVYSIAFVIFFSIDQLASKVATEISFPALSEVARERRHTLRDAYYRMHFVTAAFAYFCAGLLIVGGDELVHTLYDERYRDAGWMLQILAVGLLAIPWRLGMQCFLVFGLPKFYSHIQGVRLVSLLVLVPAGYFFWGLPGALWGIVLSFFSGVPIVFLYMKRYEMFDLRKELVSVLILPIGMLIGEVFNRLAIWYASGMLHL